MKTVVLVNPPNHGQDVYNLAPPLGLMVLAALARECGYEPKIIDLDLPHYRPFAADSRRFYDGIVQEILSHGPQIVGFTSMGVNAHVALLLAQKLNQKEPSLKQIFGGPYFASIAAAFVRVAPFAARVFAGEAEQEFCRFLGNDNYSSGNFGHPFSSYDLIELEHYFAANQRKLINYEAGRGCIFKCSFCYSPGHYKAARALDPAGIVEDLSMLAAKGMRHTFFVNDNFLNSPRHAEAVCEAIAAAKLPVTWNCYTTLPQLKPSIITGFARAGCSSIYLGIDAVEGQQQRQFNKSFLKKSSHLDEVVNQVVAAGVSPTCAFIFDLERWSPSAIAAALRVAVQCAKQGARIRFNALTPYPGTSLAGEWRQRRYSESRVRVMLDCPEVVRSNPLAKLYPEIFPFHVRPIEEHLWMRRLRTLWLAQRLIQKYPADFAVLSARDDSELTGLFEELAQEKIEEWSFSEENNYETAER